MPKKLMSCVRKVKKELAEEHKKWSAQRVTSVAYAICRKSTGQKPHESRGKSLLYPHVSFSESGKLKEFKFGFQATVRVAEKAKLDKIRPDYRPNDPDSKIVVGDAVYDTTSKNFNIYREGELKKASTSLIQKPCQVDHSTSARDTFGLVIDAWWDKETETLGYVAELDSKDPVSGKVERGYVRNVSVAGDCKEVLCSICGEPLSWTHEHWIGQEYDGKVCKADLRGITFEHLGFTPFPAVENASAIYVPTDIGESIDNAIVFMEYFRHASKQKNDYNCNETLDIESVNNSQLQQIKIQESFNMSDEYKELLKAKQKEIEMVNYDLAEAKKKLEASVAKEKEIEELKNELALKEAKERANLIKSIVALEVKTKKLDSSKMESRAKALEGKQTFALEAIEEVLEDFAKTITTETVAEAPVAGSKSKHFDFGSKFGELDESRKEFYLREAKIEKLQTAMGFAPPSVSSVKTLRAFNRHADRWNTELSDLIMQVPRRGMYPPGGK